MKKLWSRVIWNDVLLFAVCIVLATIFEVMVIHNG
jgi:hypothetical protein